MHNDAYFQEIRRVNDKVKVCFAKAFDIQGGLPWQHQMKNPLLFENQLH
jgi:hypothetical protein